jgi:hypothetical protein
MATATACIAQVTFGFEPKAKPVVAGFVRAPERVEQTAPPRRTGSFLLPGLRDRGRR